MRLRRTLILALVVAAPLAAGCGGGGDDDSTEAAPVRTEATIAAPTKEELLEQGDAICAEVNAAVGTVGASTAVESPAGQVADLYSGMVDSLKSLGTPQETDGYAEFSAAADELLTAEDEVKLAAERGDTAGLEAAEASASSALAEFQTAAQEYGFEACGEGPSAPVTGAPESGETEAGVAPEEVEPEAVEPEEEAAPEPAPETGGAGGATEGGGTTGAPEGGGGTTGGKSGGIGPG